MDTFLYDRDLRHEKVHTFYWCCQENVFLRLSCSEKLIARTALVKYLFHNILIIRNLKKNFFIYVNCFVSLFKLARDHTNLFYCLDKDFATFFKHYICTGRLQFFVCFSMVRIILLENPLSALLYFWHCSRTSWNNGAEFWSNVLLLVELILSYFFDAAVSGFPSKRRTKF